MTSTREAPPTFVWLDVARALAALVVLLGHLRAYVFNDSVTVRHLTAGWEAFYLLTSLQHQAVIVFFVLSGFLISRAITKQASAGRWSWTDYAAKRISRLWIVLLPALVLTFIWDQLGMRLTGSALYSGTLDSVNHSTPFGPLSFTLPTFLGNIAFLQSILVRPFGTDTPLWSLANEFWYYVLFPLFFFAYRPLYGLVSRIALLTIGTALCLFLLPGQCPLGVVWLMGYAAYLLYRRFKFQPQSVRAFAAIAATMLFAVVLLASKIYKLGDLTQDYITGTAFALLLIPLASIGASKWIARPAKVFAGFSYTLYVTHFPFLAFTTSLVTNNIRVEPSLHGLITFVSLFTLVLVYAFLVSLAFERNTPAIQRAVLRSLSTIRLPGRASQIALRPE